MSDTRYVSVHSSAAKGVIDERFARVAYRGYEIEGHRSQSFERLHERGGFSLEELVHYAFVAGHGSPVLFGNELDAAKAQGPEAE